MLIDHDVKHVADHRRVPARSLRWLCTYHFGANLIYREMLATRRHYLLGVPGALPAEHRGKDLLRALQRSRDDARALVTLLGSLTRALNAFSVDL